MLVKKRFSFQTADDSITVLFSASRYGDEFQDIIKGLEKYKDRAMRENDGIMRHRLPKLIEEAEKRGLF